MSNTVQDTEERQKARQKAFEERLVLRRAYHELINSDKVTRVSSRAGKKHSGTVSFNK